MNQSSDARGAEEVLTSLTASLTDELIEGKISPREYAVKRARVVGRADALHDMVIPALIAGLGMISTLVMGGAWHDREKRSKDR